MAVGEIRIDFRALVAKFQRDINKANRSLDSFGRRADRAGRLLQNFVGGLAIGVSAGGLTAMIRQSIQFADTIDKAADRLAIGTTRFQEFQFAASQASVTQQQLATGLRALTRRVGEAERGSKNYLEALNILGIEMRDVRDIGMEDTFDLVLRRLGQMEDRTDAMVAATRLFDVETGAAMLNVAKGYDNAIEKFRDAGIAIDEGIIRQAARASSELDFLNAVIRSRIVVGLRDVYDWVIENSRGMVEWIDEIIRIKKELDAFARILNRIASGELDLTPEEAAERRWLEVRRGIEQTEQQLNDFIAIRERLIAQTQALAAEDPTPENIAALKLLGEQYAGVTANIEAATERLKEFKTEGRDLGKLELPAYEDPQYEPPDPEALERAAREIIKSQFDYVKRVTEEQKKHAEKQLKDLVASEQQLLQEHYAAMIEAETAFIEASVAPGRELPDLSKETMAAEGREVFRQTRTELERINMEFARLDQLLEEGAIDFDTYARAVFDATEEAEELEKQLVDVDKVAKDMGNVFVSAFEDAVIEGEGLRDVMKGLFDDIQRILLRTAVTTPLQGFFGDLFSGFFGGGGEGAKSRQAGGPVKANEPYLVGEQGPELFLSVDPKQAIADIKDVKGLLDLDKDLGLLEGRQALTVDTGQIVGAQGPEIFVPKQAGEIKPDVDQALEDTRQKLLASLVQKEEQRAGKLRKMVDKAKEAVARFNPFEEIPGRALGGPVFAGNAYMVGERGVPEVFVPQMNGRIEPNKAGNVYNIDARGAQPGVEQSIVRAIQMAENRAVARSVAAVQEGRMRGGKFAELMGG